MCVWIHCHFFRTMFLKLLQCLRWRVKRRSRKIKVAEKNGVWRAAGRKLQGRDYERLLCRSWSRMWGSQSQLVSQLSSGRTRQKSCRWRARVPLQPHWMVDGVCGNVRFEECRDRYISTLKPTESMIIVKSSEIFELFLAVGHAWTDFQCCVPSHTWRHNDGVRV